MSKTLKITFVILLTLGLLFNSIAYAATSSASGTVGSSAPIILLNIIGTPSAAPSGTGFVFTTEKAVIYNLTGNTAGIEQYLGTKLAVRGYVVYPNPLIMAATTMPIMANQTFFVLDYKPVTGPTATPKPTSIPTPVPSPKPTLPPVNVKVAGVVSLSDQTNFSYALSAGGNIKYMLTGKTEGLDKYIGKKVVVIGYFQMPIMTTNTTNSIGVISPIYRRVLVVVDYYPMPVPIPTVTPKPTPIPTPTPTPKPTQPPIPPTNVKVLGTVSISDQAAFGYVLTTAGNMKYMLTGKTDGLDQYIGKKVVVVGYFKTPILATSNTAILPIYRRVLVVVDYYPAPEPVPTILPSPMPL